jgi:hypothetical protein
LKKIFATEATELTEKSPKLNISVAKGSWLR